MVLRRVALERTDVSEERITSVIMVTKISELATTLAVSNYQPKHAAKKYALLLLVTANGVPSPPILVTLMIGTIRSSETSILTRGTRHNIPEDGILHSHRRKNLKSYIALNGWAL
jgi:hypothetical protein